MATDINDLGDLIGSTLGRVAREATHTVSRNGHGPNLSLGGGDSPLAAAAPLAGKAAKNAVMKRVGGGGGSEDEDSEGSGKGLAGKAVEGVKGTVTGAVAKQMKEGGGESGGGSGQKGTPGVGKGRRMPVQQSVDIGVPVEVAYNQWTQFEEWPQFMHRLDQTTQEDDCTVSFKTKIWGMSKEFVAQIVEQRPDERIQWNVTEGVTHTGVVTFHELGPRLTRVMVTLDVEPGSLIEKAARGMRHVKRAVRADLHRFKAFIEMQEVETGAWRGTIHDGEVAEEHPKDYDRQREYAELDDIHDREHSHKPRESSNGSSAERASSAGATRSSRSSSPRKAGGRAKASQRGQSKARSRSGASSARKRGSARKSGARSSSSSRSSGSRSS
jgi:uncharacterized membrane protein